MNPHLVTFAQAISRGVPLVFDVKAFVDDALKPESEAHWVWFCRTAADEARAAIMENPPEAEPSTAGESTIARLAREYSTEFGDGQPLPVAPAYLAGDALRWSAHLAAAAAFKGNMPLLTNRRRARAFIACVAVGMLDGYFGAAEASKLLYAAQTALIANPKRQRSRGQKA